MKKIQFRKGQELVYPIVDGGNCYNNGVRTSSAQVIYVDANSLGDGDGTITSPYNTLEQAIEQVQDNLETDVFVTGDLRFTQTVEIGTGKKVNIIGDGNSSLLGSKLFTAQDKKCANEVKLYVGNVCPQWIFVDGKVRYPASTSRDDLYMTNCEGTADIPNDTMTTAITVPVADAVKIAAANYSEMWVTVLWMWMSYKCRIDHVDTTNGVLYCIQSYGNNVNNRLHEMTGSLRIILENANISSCSMFDGEDLWQKGTYYVNDGYLYYKYLDDEDIYGNIEVPCVETLIHADGDVSLYNLNIGQTDHVFDNTYGEGEHRGFAGRQACARFNAAIELNGSSKVMYCNFFYTTNHSLRLYNSSHDCIISDNTFRNLGCSSVVVGWLPIDYTTTVPSYCPNNVSIERNIIVTTGRIYACSCGLTVIYGSNYKIRFNVIRNTYYTGITTGYTWSSSTTNPNKNGLIEYNVIDLIGVGVQALYDGGAFYNLGNASGLVVRYNIVTNVYGYTGDRALRLDGYFADEGSSNVTITKNLFYHCGSFYRFNTTTSTVTIENNIFYDDIIELTSRTSGHINHNVFLYNHAPSSSSAFNNNVWYKIDGQQDTITWDSNGVSGNPFYDVDDKDYRIANSQVAESGNFIPFMPIVVGKWVDSKLSETDMEKIIYYLTTYWDSDFPK